VVRRTPTESATASAGGICLGACVLCLGGLAGHHLVLEWQALRALHELDAEHPDCCHVYDCVHAWVLASLVLLWGCRSALVCPGSMSCIVTIYMCLASVLMPPSEGQSGIRCWPAWWCSWVAVFAYLYIYWDSADGGLVRSLWHVWGLTGEAHPSVPPTGKRVR
jgi:hypothetical protein